MTRLFNSYDQYQITTNLTRDAVISILKRKICLNESAFRRTLHPSVPNQYFGEFSYPNRFVIKRGLNPMMGGLNAGSITEIDIDMLDNKTILSFKINNMGSKMIFIVIFAALIIISLVGLFSFRIDLYLWILLLIGIATGVLGLGKVIIGTLVKEQKKYFQKILR
jgi:hypothetical protein